MMIQSVQLKHIQLPQEKWAPTYQQQLDTQLSVKYVSPSKIFLL